MATRKLKLSAETASAFAAILGGKPEDYSNSVKVTFGSDADARKYDSLKSKS